MLCPPALATHHSNASRAMLDIPESTLRLVLAARQAARRPTAPGAVDALPAAPPPGPPTLRDDGCHYPLYRTHDHANWYVEWWYFAFRDSASGVSGILAFTIFNPAGHETPGVSSIAAVLFDERAHDVTTRMDIHPAAAFCASYDRADISIDRSTVRVLDADTYALHVESADAAVRADLEYRRADEARWLGHRIRGTTRPWEVSSWMSWFPSASVSGTIQLGERVIRLDAAAGYHDHNWAVWLFPLATWTWAMFSSPDRRLNLDFAQQRSFDYTAAYLRWGDVRLEFPQDRLTFSVGEWRHWRLPFHHAAFPLPWKYPVHASLTGTDVTDRYRLELQWRARLVAPLWKSPMIVFEQTADFEGTLAERDGTGWTERLRIAEQGFYEYTAEWL
jgi:hypothetical protein